MGVFDSESTLQQQIQKWDDASLPSNGALSWKDIATANGIGAIPASNVTLVSGNTAILYEGDRQTEIMGNELHAVHGNRGIGVDGVNDMQVIKGYLKNVIGPETDQNIGPVNVTWINSIHQTDGTTTTYQQGDWFGAGGAIYTNAKNSYTALDYDYKIVNQTKFRKVHHKVDIADTVFALAWLAKLDILAVAGLALHLCEGAIFALKTGLGFKLGATTKAEVAPHIHANTPFS